MNRQSLVRKLDKFTSMMIIAAACIQLKVYLFQLEETKDLSFLMQAELVLLIF